MAKSFNLNLSSRKEASSKTMILQNMIEGDRPDYQYININRIEFNSLNDYAEKDSETSIRELANDIKRNGLLHNIVVSLTPDGKYKLLSGERRLRAARLLFEETGDAKYQNIYALIRKGLTETEEMIILDAANLQTRGGMSGEVKYRKASVRFVENLKKQYGISEEEAISLTKQYAGVTDAVIEKNISIEKNLDESLLSFLDEGELPKQRAYEYSKMDNELQKTIGEKLTEARENGEKEMREVNDIIAEPAKKIRTLTDTLAKKKENLKDIKRSAKETNDEQSSSLLFSQAEKEKKRINEIKKEIKKEVKKIEDAGNEASLSFSSSLSLLSSFSSSLSSFLSSLPISSLSSSEKEKLKKEITKEKKRLDSFLKENF